MSVSLTWSSTAGGAAISAALSHGSSANGSTTTAQQIYLRHDGSNAITDVAFYIRQFSGTYAGSFTGASDINEILGWGDGTTAASFGGVQFNFNATGSYPLSSWPTVGSKSPSGGATCRSTVGDSEANAITLPTTTGANTEGQIDASETDVRFKVRIEVPSDEDTVGYRQFDIVCRYDYTS